MRYAEKTPRKPPMTHAQLRILQRYGYRMRENGLLKLAELCRCRRYCCRLGGPSGSRSKIVVRYKDMLMPVIYDRKQDRVVTVLTMEMLSVQEREAVTAEENRRQRRAS